jgi:hypothetical protein
LAELQHGDAHQHHPGQRPGRDLVYAEQKLAGALTLGSSSEEQWAHPADLGLEAVQLTNTYLARHHGGEQLAASIGAAPVLDDVTLLAV